MTTTSDGTHEDFESFDAAEYGDTLLVRDGAGAIWTAFETDSGDWWAVRPRHEDDETGPEGDEWRPVGLVDLEALPFPLRVVVAHDALADPAGAIAKHEQEVRAEVLRVLRERDVLLARIGEELDTAEIEHALPDGPWGEVVETVISLVQAARVVAVTAARTDALTEVTP